MIRSDCLCSADPATNRELDRLRGVGQDDLLARHSLLSDFGVRLRCVRRLTSSAAWTLDCATSQEQFRTSGCTLTCETGVSGESAGGGIVL